jgi:hypothetical protein
MKEYLLLAAFMIPSLVVLGAAVVSVSHADDPAAQMSLGSSAACAARQITNGGPDEYAELQRLRLEHVREHEQLLMAWSPYAPAAVWGPWKPEGLDLK